MKQNDELFVRVSVRAFLANHCVGVVVVVCQQCGWQAPSVTRKKRIPLHFSRVMQLLH